MIKRRSFLTLAAACCIAACAEERIEDPSIASAEQKIINGQDEPGFTAVGALVLYDDDSNEYSHRFCSGTLIRPNWVITAGHCDVQGDVDLDEIWFLVGEHAESSIDGSLPEGSTLHSVKRIIQHPLYKGFPYNYDIALMELDEPVTGVEPMPLFAGDLQAYRENSVKAVGYGITAYGSRENDARRRSTDLHFLRIYDANYIVQGDDSGTCQGDSGGPDLINIDGEWQICGVNSISITPEEDVPSVSDACLYPSGKTRVDAFRSWILQNIGEEADCRLDPTLCHCAKACGDDGQCEPYRCGEHRTCYEAVSNQSIDTLETAIEFTGAFYQLSPEDIQHVQTLQACFSASESDDCKGANIVCESQKLPLGTGEASCLETMLCMAACRDYSCVELCNDASRKKAGRHAQASLVCALTFECPSVEPSNSCMQSHCSEIIEDCLEEEDDDDDEEDGGVGPEPLDGGISDAEIDAELDASDADLIDDGGDADASGDAIIDNDADGEDASGEDATSDADGEDASGEDATSDASEDATSEDASEDASVTPEDSGASADSGSSDAAKTSEKDAEIDEEDDDDSDDGCSAMPGSRSGSWLAFLGLPLLFGRRRQRA